jgi:hypothetical protein
LINLTGLNAPLKTKKMKGLLTVKQYAEKMDMSIATVNQRRYRGTLKWKTVDGLIYVYVNSDTTINKPRKRASN